MAPGSSGSFFRREPNTPFPALATAFAQACATQTPGNASLDDSTLIIVNCRPTLLA
jgi:hypothetical protein